MSPETKIPPELTKAVAETFVVLKYFNHKIFGSKANLRP